MRPTDARHGRRRPPEVWLLAVMAAVAGLRGVLVAIDPPDPETPVRAYLVVAAVATTLSLVVWFFPRRWCLHAVLVAGVGVAAFVVATAATGTGPAAIGLGYVWIVLYSAIFFSRRVTRAYLVVSVCSYGVALLLNPFPGVLGTAVPLVLTISVVAEVTSGMVAALHRAATTDPLTGLLNRHGLFAAATHALAQARRSGRPLTIVIVDLNGFKLINDRHGHAAGDRMLSALAQTWRPLLREADIVARYGGDEFVLVLPDTDRVAALEVTQRLREHSPVAWSYGLVVASPDRELEALLSDADAALYRAKATSRWAPVPRQGDDVEVVRDRPVSHPS